MTAPAPPTPTHWLRAFIGVAAVLLVLGGFIWAYLGLNSGPGRPGVDSVYDRIDSSTSCGQLQAEFNAASANQTREIKAGRREAAEIALSYMRAAEERMAEIGC
jgi:hypothetical protein